MYVGFLVISILDLAFSYGVDRLERYFAPWHDKR